jgi:hypothetical protein
MLVLGFVKVNVAVVVPPKAIVAGATLVTTVGAKVLVPCAVVNKLKLLPMADDSTAYSPLIDPTPLEVNVNSTVHEALGAIGAEQPLVLLLSGFADEMFTRLTGALPTL